LTSARPRSVEQLDLSVGQWMGAENTQWILGFLSGVGWVHLDGQNPLDGLDAQAVWAWVDNWSHAHPLDNLTRAGEVFASTHPGR
jgi:hypothetical protein